MKSILGFLLAAVGLTGCAPGALLPTRHYTLSSTYNPADVAWFNQPGTATLSGQAFFQTGGGNPRTCAGLKVALVPQSTYANERIKDIYGSDASGYVAWNETKVEFDHNDLGYEQNRKTTVCDAQGNFTFSNLPAGNYYVISAIVWQLPYAGFSGGSLMQRVSLSTGEAKRIILTP